MKRIASLGLLVALVIGSSPISSTAARAEDFCSFRQLEPYFVYYPQWVVRIEHADGERSLSLCAVKTAYSFRDTQGPSGCSRLLFVRVSIRTADLEDRDYGFGHGGCFAVDRLTRRVTLQGELPWSTLGGIAIDVSIQLEGEPQRTLTPVQSCPEASGSGLSSPCADLIVSEAGPAIGVVTSSALGAVHLDAVESRLTEYWGVAPMCLALFGC